LHSGTILVIDEPREAQAVKAIFGGASYRVLTAEGGESALQILNSERRVELVLSEVLLPDAGDGGAFLARIRLTYPSTAVMLMASARERSSDSTIPVVVKPFSAAALIDRVEQLLVETRQTAASLRTAFQWNREARAELEAAHQTLVESVRRSRRRRCDHFCARLRVPGARIPTILLAEDDAALRYAVARFLVRCGFHVLDAPDGARALQLSREHPGAIDLILTDLQMPGLDGLSLIRAIESERPTAQTLFMTAAADRLQGRTVRKPFELDDLLAEIVAVLVHL
jgi:CheY-like chemotaxis protein